MANKAKKSSGGAAKKADDNVVRIKAGASSKKAEKAESVAAPAVVKAAKPAKVKKPRSGGVRGVGIFRAIGGYFKGAWQELRLVRWPNRRATWSLTFAVLAYSAFFVVLVLLLDAGFKLMFDFILKK